MTRSESDNNQCSINGFLRPGLRRYIPSPLSLIAVFFAVHAAIRFGALWQAYLLPLSMIIIWPLPWLLLTREGRQKIGIKAPNSLRWFLLGPLAASGVLVLCAVLAWLVFGSGTENWFIRHAQTLNEALKRIPESTSRFAMFGIVTLPAMIFSPLGEEFLFRGFMLERFSMKWNNHLGNVLQAMAFALVHLAHYGLYPFQPGLIAVWLPSMFAAAIAFGWIVQKSDSIWPAVVSHSVFNMGMNGIVFLFFPV